MAVPLFPRKMTGREISGPSRWAGYMSDQEYFRNFPVPDLMIFTWQKSLFSRIKSRYAHFSSPGFPGEVIFIDGTRSHEGGKGEIEPRIGIAGGFGIGAPAAVFMMEALGALGVRRFLGLGTAGGLMSAEEFSRGDKNRSLRAGDILLADRAFRDEGTSYHYQEGDEPAVPDGTELRALEELLENGRYPYGKGAVWSTDAFFRETEKEVEFYLSRGVRAVDMEASALYACAGMRGYSMASLFVISDVLTEEGWAPDFHHRNVGKMLNRLFQDIASVD